MRYLIFACALAMSQLAAHAEGRAWLGLTIGDVTSNEEVLRLGWSSGVPVLEVHAGSPASSAGIRAGDIIVDLDGERVINANELICRSPSVLRVLRPE